MPKFQVGDMVRVKPDGPDMMVEGFDEAGRVLCSFWEGVTRKLDYFAEADLEQIPPPARK
jgi:uncharacterized protein YodC (DUF2158 family)